MGLLDFLSGGKNKLAREAQQKAVDLTGQLQVPDVADMEVQLQDLVSQGILTPEQAKVYLQDPTAYDQIQTDPALQQAQLDALASLQEIGAGGMTNMDRAQLAKISAQEDSQARGAREAIMQQAQARGAGGSGMEILAQLQNAQDSVTRRSARDTDVAGMAQQRALEALQQAGALGGQMQSTSFNQQAQKAGAKDAIAQFNASTQNQMGLSNTQIANNAAAQNLAEKQRIADANIANKNAQEAANKALVQQNFNNQLQKTGQQTNALTGQAANYNQQGQQGINLAGNLLQAVGTAAAASLGAPAKAASDKNLKEDVEPFDASKFLDELTAVKYKYKDPKWGNGPQVGVMAQDLEKGAPQMVVDTPEGKMVDYNKAGGPLFASLADIHERLKKVEGK